MGAAGIAEASECEKRKPATAATDFNVEDMMGVLKKFEGFWYLYRRFETLKFEVGR